MTPWLPAILLVTAAVTLLRSTQRVANRTQPRHITVDASFGEKIDMTFDEIYETVGGHYSVNPNLLKAIAIQESGEAPQAVNPRDPSVGLMQILCVPDGNGGCANKFNINGWPPKNKEQLFDPAYNVGIATQILAWNLDNYGYPKGIAIYNAWSARHDPRDGPFRNQDYVDGVLKNFNPDVHGDPRDGSARVGSSE